MNQRVEKRYRKGYVLRFGLMGLMGVISFLILSYTSAAHATQVTLAWSPPGDGSVVDGYRIYSRLEGQTYNYSQPTWQGTTTTSTIADLQAVTTYFVVRAYNSYGDSGDSNEAVYQPATTSPAISRTPSSLSVSCTQGSNATSQSFQISNSGGGTLSYTISDDATWLSCSPTTGISTGEQDTITVSYTTSGLAAGAYAATITVTATGASNTPQTLPVSLTVNAAPAAISRTPSSLSASCTQGTNAASQSFEVWNSGGGTLSYTVGTNASWVSCSPTSGTSTGTHNTVTVSYSTSGLTAGTYSAAITVSATGVSNSPQTIPVSLTVSAAPSTISRTPSSLSTSCTQGANAASQIFQISNSGTGTLSYSISDDAGWLSCSPTSGSSTGEQDTITVSYATSALSAGAYSAAITITATGASNTPQTLPVSLTVNAAPAAISRTPSSLSASCTQGTNAASQSFEVWNSGGGTLSYTISDDAGWLACNATSGTSTGAHNTVTVTYSTSTMTPGTYSAAITIAATGASNTPQTIPVNLTVSDSQILPMEVGQVIVNQDWARVTFNRSFVDPVVVVGIATTNDPDPAVPRVRNLDRSGFDVRIQEWDYLDGVHGWDTVGYVVMERGDYVLPDGTRVEAGRFMTNKTNSFGSMRFAQPFQKVPIILASVTTVNEADAVTTRLRRIRTSAFEFRMQEQELNVQKHATETVCYIAWEPSSGTVEGLPFEVGRSNNVVPQTDQRVSFRQTFKTPPAFIAGIETTNGPDTASARCRSLDLYQADVQITTEQSLSSGTDQTAEVVGYIVFGAP